MIIMSESMECRSKRSWLSQRTGPGPPRWPRIIPTRPARRRGRAGGVTEVTVEPEVDSDSDGGFRRAELDGRRGGFGWPAGEVWQFP